MARVDVSNGNELLLRRTDHRLIADPSRCISRLFVPGQEDFGSKQSRTGRVLERVLVLTEEEVCEALDDVYERFGARHSDLTHILENHAHRVANRVGPGAKLSDERWRLIGALFTRECSVEGAALTNPSVVMHPNQNGTKPGSVRFIMSLRGIGEGHRSSIGFRSGVIDNKGVVDIDPPAPHPMTGTHWEPLLDSTNFRGLLEDMDDLGENARFILGLLGEQFTLAELNHALLRFVAERDSFLNPEVTAEHFRVIAERNYTVTYPKEVDISERIIWPNSRAEWHGMEDARFVRFVDDSGEVTYFATYTAFDGSSISQQLLSTPDFGTFETTPISGKAAEGKGMAIFPRKVGGMYMAMSRADDESNLVTISDNLTHWSAITPVQFPRRTWEIVQLGNCGSPIETEAGWLLLNHSIGPMRTYCISAVLLDLEDPSKVIGELEKPILWPLDGEQRDGYVPNVVYSCGSLVHGNTLMMPFGIADKSIGIAVGELDRILNQLVS